MAQNIEPQNIKVGDKIRVTSTQSEGGVQIFEDTVTSATGKSIGTRSFAFRSEYDGHFERTYELLERPTPVEPTKVGTIVETKDDTFIKVPHEIRPTLYGREFGWIAFREDYHYSAVTWKYVMDRQIVKVTEP